MKIYIDLLIIYQSCWGGGGRQKDSWNSEKLRRLCTLKFYFSEKKREGKDLVEQIFDAAVSIAEIDILKKREGEGVEGLTSKTRGNTILSC